MELDRGQKKVGIIDYGMGNLRSVRNAFFSIGAKAEIITEPEKMEEFDFLVLPGVGAFGDGMRNLAERGFSEALKREVVEKKKPFLGICLGMQLLADKGYEHGEYAGLGLIRAQVKKIEPADQSVRVPHIGWNDVEIIRTGKMYSGLSSTQVFYFVHSFVLCCEDEKMVNGYFSHGGRWAASIECENILATQYHPEKSQKSGILVLKNFLLM